MSDLIERLNNMANFGPPLGAALLEEAATEIIRLRAIEVKHRQLLDEIEFANARINCG